MGEALLVVPAKRSKKVQRSKIPAKRARKTLQKSSPSLPNGTREEWYPLASDPDLHTAGVEIGARATFKGKGAPELRIVFRRGSTEAYVTCVHVAVYAGPLESLPSDAELARSSEHQKIHLAPEEHFFALNSFVAGIAEIGLRTMFAAAREAGDLPVGFNALMQAQFLQALFNIEPTATLELCLWVMDDAAQASGASRKARDYFIPIKKVVAGNKNAPVEILARLAGDDDQEVQKAVASNITWWNCTPEILAGFAGDADPRVRFAVAKHQHTPPTALAILAGDADKEIRRAVALHKQTPPEVLARLADDPELAVRGGVACNEHTPPEALARLALSCPICKVLGEKMFVDYDADMNFPEEVRGVKEVISFGYDDDLRRCSLCGTYFKFDYETDNDIICPTHTGEYKRIPAEKAEQMISEEQARQKATKQRYKREVRRKHGKVIDTLPEVERKIIAYLTDRLYDYSWAENLQKDLGLDAATMDNALAHLMQVNVVSQKKDGNYVRYSICTI